MRSMCLIIHPSSSGVVVVRVVVVVEVPVVLVVDVCVLVVDVEVKVVEVVVVVVSVVLVAVDVLVVVVETVVLVVEDVVVVVVVVVTGMQRYCAKYMKAQPPMTTSPLLPLPPFMVASFALPDAQMSMLTETFWGQCGSWTSPPHQELWLSSPAGPQLLISQ